MRDFDFSEPFPDPAGELHLNGPISGYARLTRTSEMCPSSSTKNT